VSDYYACAFAPLPLCRTVVVAKKAAQARTPPNAAFVVLASGTVDQVVAEPLMVALAMIVDEELGEGAAEVPLTHGIRRSIPL
jgi:hypothetical protein